MTISLSETTKLMSIQMESELHQRHLIDMVEVRKMKELGVD